MLLIITWSATEIVLSLFRFCVLLLFCRLYYFSFHDGYTPYLYITQSICIAAVPFLINWNEKRCSESNIPTMDHELALDNSSSVSVYTLQNTITYLKVVKYWVFTGRDLLTLSWRRSISYRNRFIDLQSKPMDWFLYDISLHHERVKQTWNLR